jgi:hypothetical protein
MQTFVFIRYIILMQQRQSTCYSDNKPFKMFHAGMYEYACCSNAVY